ncbi:DNA damage-inducible transcript 3 protein [Latimeria chalumnae]|uniref:DNA damage inducible transcript 3 n=1 Tax=Latimeria chalumnae TaxID=7897 RepID=H3BHU2_LATCH|nr:PREDICTED: DNA damage-inducible transcript 3 protein [Latimeria chalumnae]|eukprot:XP_005986255.1 PREDICTED: DNA damage-inducible transcript 3 protein [Latimeria chalumnae]
MYLPALPAAKNRYQKEKVLRKENNITSSNLKQVTEFVQVAVPAMTAEPLVYSYSPFSGTMSRLELETLYEDLQDILASDVDGGAGLKPLEPNQETELYEALDTPSSSWTVDSGSASTDDVSSEVSQFSGLADLLSTELCDLLGDDEDVTRCQQSFTLPASEEESSSAPESCSNSPSSSDSHPEEQELGTRRWAAKRKRNDPWPGAKMSRKEKERHNESKVEELIAENERLKEVIKNLSAEVESTRKALIEKMVDLK